MRDSPPHLGERRPSTPVQEAKRGEGGRGGTDGNGRKGIENECNITPPPLGLAEEFRRFHFGNQDEGEGRRARQDSHLSTMSHYGSSSPQQQQQVQHRGHHRTPTERLSNDDDEVVRPGCGHLNRSDPIGAEHDLVATATPGPRALDAHPQLVQHRWPSSAGIGHSREASHQPCQAPFVEGGNGHDASFTNSASNSTATRSVSGTTNWNDSFASNETSLSFDTSIDKEEGAKGFDFHSIQQQQQQQQQDLKSSMTLSGTEIFHNTAVMGNRPLSTVPPSTASFVTSRSSPSHLVRASWAPSANTDRTGYFDHHPDLLSFNNSLGGTSPQQPLQHHQHSHGLHLSQPMSLHESASGSYFDEVRNTSAPPTVQSLRTRMSSIIPEEAPSDLEEWSRQSQDPGKQINVVASSWADFVNQHKGSRSKTSEGIPRHALCRLQQLLKGEEELPKSRKDLEQDIASLQKQLEQSEHARSSLNQRVKELEEELTNVRAVNNASGAADKALNERFSPLIHANAPYDAAQAFPMPVFALGSEAHSEMTTATLTPDSLNPYYNVPSFRQALTKPDQGTMSPISSTGGHSTDSSSTTMDKSEYPMTPSSNPYPLPPSAQTAPSFIPGAGLHFCPTPGLQHDGSPRNASNTVSPRLFPTPTNAPPPLTRSPAPYMGGTIGLSPNGQVHPYRHQHSHYHDLVGVSPRTERSPRMANLESQVPVDVLISRALGTRSQDASISLQQQLKTAPSARKAAIIAALEPHVFKLSDDKHGNFLVQRAIGVDNSLAEKLRRHFVQLSLSQFGCHVVQRILDEPDNIKNMVVEELLADRIEETLVSRNSIHVWQKVLSICWGPDFPDARRRLFSVVNATMKGKWAETACQETGSIVCQNIFESASSDEKRDCMGEILEKLKDCAANQWGVWVVQHIVEHGDDEHRRVAFEHLLEDAVGLTLSPFGQKAITSALKSRDKAFVGAYVDILCEQETGHGAGSDQPGRRSVLVDIAGAAQGVQIVTTLLTSVQADQRDRIIKTVRKNSVFLKGSKAGLRVHQLCERARAFTGY